MKKRSFIKQLMHNKSGCIGLCIILFFVFVAVSAHFIAPHDPLHINIDFLKLSPFKMMTHPLGTDDIGRDVFSRIIYGAQISLFIGVSVVIISLSIGTLLGLLAGYFKGFVDKIIMHFIELIMSFPSILLAIIIITILEPGIKNAIIAVAIVAIPNFARVIRAKVMEEKEKEYVHAAISFGSHPFRILFKEILPNCMNPLMIQASLGISDGILNTAALGFLGLGATPPLPEWGVMLSDARLFIESSPYLIFFPGICILLTALGFNLLGNGLRDILDPKIIR